MISRGIFFLSVSYYNMYPRKKTWSFNKKESTPNKAIEIINPAIITAEASPTGVLLDGKGKETEITFKPKTKAKPKEPEEDVDEEPRKKPAQRLLETLKKEKKEVIRPIELMKTKKTETKRPQRKPITEEDRKRIREIINNLNDD